MGVLLDGLCAAGGGGEKVPSSVKWATTDDLGFSSAALYTDLKQHSACLMVCMYYVATN